MRKTFLAGLIIAGLSAGPLAAQTAAPVAPAKPPMPPAMSTNAPAPAAKPAAAQAAALVDLNSASKAELMKLPGIGEARSEAIVRNRPYRGKDDIVAKAGIPNNVYDGIKDQVVARQR